MEEDENDAKRISSLSEVCPELERSPMQESSLINLDVDRCSPPPTTMLSSTGTDNTSHVTICGIDEMGMRQGDYQITMMELPQGYPNNPFPINQLYRICHCKIPKVKFRFWEDNWQEAADIWDVLNDSSSIYRWQYSREEWNLY
ncbi:uncharacterized protein LOC121841395 isoform X2 [Oncorhynchus tshawytscha]|uniref:uncharacterized protein LOC121841395 isoform X2 n=1 Tax=Oncorhynchus tshawytscha TaxID=74940 RepID=UPI001C3DFB2C|nr:uncharacterized protein LOC121841395 isoform X2 [Oncorhynchus tshawytscha]